MDIEKQNKLYVSPNLVVSTMIRVFS